MFPDSAPGSPCVAVTCFAPPVLGGDASGHAPALTSPARFPLRGAAADARLPPPPLSRALPSPVAAAARPSARRWPEPRARASVPGCPAMGCIGSRSPAGQGKRRRPGTGWGIGCGCPVRGPRMGGGLEEGAGVGRGRSLYRGGGSGKRREREGAGRGLKRRLRDQGLPAFGF